MAGTFHYPASTYADVVRTVLKPGTGRLIVTPKAKMRQAKSLEAFGFTCRVRTWEQGPAPLTVCCIGCRNESISLNVSIDETEPL